MAIYRNQTGGVIESPAQLKFYEDVIKGLSSSPKYLESKYFYDAEGDKLFQKIMELPEYYLTRCEYEIFSTQAKEICDTLLKYSKEFDIVELGAGDATKSKFLLMHLVNEGIDFTYYPIDISEHVIEYLENTLPVEIPNLKIVGLNGEYFDMIQEANSLSNRKKVYLFLGSNIGNFTPEEAEQFLSLINKNITSGDLLFIGFDLKKNPEQILAAYNDAQGVTKEFNLNLLRRINRELDGNFDENKFDHSPVYNEETGACESYLVSKENHTVKIADKEISFSKDEKIHLEISQKYSLSEIESLLTNCGFIPKAQFFDSNKWFTDIAAVK
jgi:dimethylhistidine N-methyltransferase